MTSPQDPIRLSEAGAARRRAILDLAQGAMADRVVARRRRRTTAAMAAMFVIAGAGLLVAERAGRSGGAPRAPHVDASPDDWMKELDFPCARIDDDSLAAELRAAGVPMGTMRVDGQLRLVTLDGAPASRAAAGVIRPVEVR